jgi:hypothetical protein
MIVRLRGTQLLLISQVDHAAVAGRIAAHWRLPAPLAGLVVEFLFAVAHHDDGWRDWEQAPGVDAAGRPRDFMDMPLTDAAEIWYGSISVAVQHSCWSGLWVSRHFCHLAQLAIEHRRTESDRSAARRFLAAQSSRQQHWRGRLGVGADSPIERVGLQGLQFFDRLSLWLCCAAPTGPQDFHDPAGGTTRWEPIAGDVICVASVAFAATSLELAVPAIAVPRRSYADNADLHAAIAAAPRSELHWTLHRSTAKP